MGLEAAAICKSFFYLLVFCVSDYSIHGCVLFSIIMIFHYLLVCLTIALIDGGDDDEKGEEMDG